MKVNFKKYVWKISAHTQAVIKWVCARINFIVYLLYLTPKERRNPIFLAEKSNSQKGMDLIWNSFVVPISAHTTFNNPIDRRVRYDVNGDSFYLNLNIKESTQCMYYFSAPYLPLCSLFKSAKEKNKNGVFVDIGANVGFYSLLAALFFDRVYAFEPTPSTYKRLMGNISDSEKSNIVPYSYALSDQNGTMKLYENPTNLGGNSFNGFSEEFKKKSLRSEWFSYDVPVKKYDDVVKESRIEQIDLIKIDVEGHESQVLKGSLESIEKFKPLLFIETTNLDQYKSIVEVLPQEYQAFDPHNKTLIPRDYKGPWKLSDVIYSISDSWNN